MYQPRIRRIACVYIFLVSLLVARLAQLQVLYGAHYRKRTEENILDLRQTPSWRGTIRDRNGEILARDELSWNFSIIFNEFDHAYSSLKEFRSIMPLPRRVFRKIPDSFKVHPYWMALDETKQNALLDWAENSLFMDRDYALDWLSAPELQLRALVESVIRQRQQQLLTHASKILQCSIAELKEAIDKRRTALQKLIDKKWETTQVFRQPQPVFNNIDIKVAESIELRHEQFPAAIISSSLRRDYPYGAICAHITGYVASITEQEYAQRRLARDQFEGRELKPCSQDMLVGRTGLERRYEEILRGKDGVDLVERNAHGTIQKIVSSRLPVSGGDIQLTLDVKLQRAVTDILRRKNVRGACVLVDIKTGDVLALVSYPNFDSNWFIAPKQNKKIRQLFANTTANKRRSPTLNRAVKGMYPAGSVIKPFLAMAALDNNFITATHTEDCAWGATSQYAKKRCEGVHNHVGVVVALQRSCNIFFYNVGVKLGVENLHRYFSDYGLGKKTGIELGAETVGLLGSPAWKRARFNKPWYPSETEDMSIGQGFLQVSPLQIARGMAAIANGGTLFECHIIDTVQGKKIQRKGTDLNISDDTLDLVRRGMWLVTHEQGGTAFHSGISEYGAVGKTGTAQVYRKEPHAWFAGYAPFENPEVAFAVIIENGGHGGTVAAPIAKDMLAAYFQIPDANQEDR